MSILRGGAPTAELRVLLQFDPSVTAWVAVVIDLNLAAQGATAAEALELAGDVVRLHVDDCRRRSVEPDVRPDPEDERRAHAVATRGQHVHPSAVAELEEMLFLGTISHPTGRTAQAAEAPELLALPRSEA